MLTWLTWMNISMTSTVLPVGLSARYFTFRTNFVLLCTFRYFFAVESDTDVYDVSLLGWFPNNSCKAALLLWLLSIVGVFLHATCLNRKLYCHLFVSRLCHYRVKCAQ